MVSNKPVIDQLLDHFWDTAMKEIEEMEDVKTNAIPLARIKKVMKLDDEVKMISAEAPSLVSKACELFILEVAHRTWMHTGSSKRRTIQKSDVAVAISKSDLFDFLIDIVPREELKPMAKKALDDASENMEYQYVYQPQNGQKDGGTVEDNGQSSTTLYSNYMGSNTTDQDNLNQLVGQYNSSMYSQGMTAPLSLSTINNENREEHDGSYLDVGSLENLTIPPT